MKIKTKALSKKELVLSYSVAFLLISVMVGVAELFKESEIILPEIAAMTVAFLGFREKSWMKQPEKIFILPSITAIFGFGINLIAIPYSLKLSLILLFMLSLMYFLRYNLAPALATGFLPIVTNAHSFSFIASILICTLLLMAIVLLFKLNKGTERKATIEKSKMISYLFIVSGWIVIASLIGYKNIAIIPPVAVVLYESIHMEMYTTKMAVKQTLLLFISAGIGMFLFLKIDNWIMVAMLDLLSMWMILRAFKMQVPAVYGFPFLAFILPRHALYVLPWASLGMCLFCFGGVLLYKNYGLKISPGKRFWKGFLCLF